MCTLNFSSIIICQEFLTNTGEYEVCQAKSVNWFRIYINNFCLFVIILLVFFLNDKQVKIINSLLSFLRIEVPRKIRFFTLLLKGM